MAVALPVVAPPAVVLAATVALPVVATEPNGPHAESYLAIAGRVLDTLAGKPERAAPRIVIE